MPVDLVIEDVSDIIQDKNPCDPKCPLRTATCHATCGRYAKWAKRQERKRQIIHKEKQQHNAIVENVIRTAERMRKHDRKGR